MNRPKTKKITLDIRRKSEARKLTKLLAEGWVIVSEHKRGALSWKPGYVDYVLTKF
jgi:hypothetical protein|nr:MAG TPA: Protein of unknown function (DUF2674) [Siphoviridae sp. ctvS314]